MRLIIISFKDTDISDGLGKLLALPGKSFTEVLAPHISEDFIKRIEQVAEQYDVPVSIAPPVALSSLIQQDDVLAFSWDNTEAIHKAFLSVEDFGLECWDVSEGLASIETVPEEEDLEEVLVSSFMNLMDAMTDYITENIMAMMEHQIQHMMEEDDD